MLNAADREYVIQMARARLANRPDTLARFEHEMQWGQLGTMIALFADGEIELIKTIAPLEARKRYLEKMTQVLEGWIKRQPEAPAPVVIEALPANDAPTVIQKPAQVKQTLPRILKKNLLIAELESTWPSIKADLKEAQRNKLREAASAGHGLWDVDKATQWAAEHGRLRDTAEAPSLAKAWNGPVTRHRM